MYVTGVNGTKKVSEEVVKKQEIKKSEKSAVKEVFQEKAADLQLSNNTMEQVKSKQQEGEQERQELAKRSAQQALSHAEPQYGVHEETNRITIKLVDQETQEVIKEIPPEKNLDILAKSLEIAGVKVDKKL